MRPSGKGVPTTSGTVDDIPVSHTAQKGGEGRGPQESTSRKAKCLHTCNKCTASSTTPWHGVAKVLCPLQSSWCSLCLCLGSPNPGCTGRELDSSASNLINKHMRKIWTWVVHSYTLGQGSSSRLLVSECILIVFPLLIIPYGQVSLSHQTQPVTGRRPLSLHPCSILRFRGSPWGLIHHTCRFRFLRRNL